MTGIFGYIAHHCNECNKNNLIEAIKENGFLISNQIFIESSFFGVLNFNYEENVKTILIKNKDNLNIISTGEIYNQDIENLNEYILNLYKVGELEKVTNINGAFAVAIYDNSNEKLLLITDRHNLIKIFYYFGTNQFCFAPKTNLLLEFDCNKKLNKDSIMDFFLFGYLQDDKTFFENIHQVPPASILEFSNNEVKITKYWDIIHNDNKKLQNEEILINELGHFWQKSVERRINPDEKIIIPLSGGLDSRAILAAALKCTNRDNIITCSFGEAGSFDFEIGKLVAEKAGVKHIPLGVERGNYDKQYNYLLEDMEGMIDATPYFPPFGYETLKNCGNIILSGYIGDFIMGSHIHSEMITKILATETDYLDAAELFFQKEILFNLETQGPLFSPLVFPTIKNTINYKLIRSNSNQKMADLYFKHFLNNHVNNYSYYAVFRFRNQFLYRCPFLDNDLVDFMREIPLKLRKEQRLYRLMLLKMYPEIFSLPTKTKSGLNLNSGTFQYFLVKTSLNIKRIINKLSQRILKEDIFLEKAKNYMNYDDLVRKNPEYRAFIRQLLNKVGSREFFNKDHIENLWNLHQQGKNNYAIIFGLLVTFELFLEKFIDD